MRKLEENKKYTKGITLIALIVTIVVLIILSTITIGAVFSENGILKRAKEQKGSLDSLIKKNEDEMNKLLDEYNNSTNGSGSGDGSGGGNTTEPDTPPTPEVKDEDDLAVEPKLSQGMIPVKWNGTNWEKTTKEDEEWYKYSKRNKKWANIVLGDATFNTVNGKEVLDESKAYTQLVWIPRYAYKITSMYHMNGDENTSGNIEVVFIDSQNKDKNGTIYSEIYPAYTSGASGAMADYVVHPAFNYGSDKLDGMWVGKYETSHTGCTQDKATGEKTYTGKEVLQIKANVTIWRQIKVSDMYTTCINMNKAGNVYGLNTSDSVVDPHMLKNSEWGAVAYLSKSKYGKETEEVYVNNNMNYITGIAGDTVAESTSSSKTNTYNTEKGQKASTTGNIYGVYDMSGGTWEYVAGYVANGDGSLTRNGEKLVNGPDKHKDVYKNNGDTRAGNYSVANAANGKYGDAVYETSNSGESNNNSWYSDGSNFPYSSSPFFVRGGSCGDRSSAGVFYFKRHWWLLRRLSQLPHGCASITIKS